MAYETILVDNENGVGVITLNRPDAMNALNTTVMQEVACAIGKFETDDAVGCVVILGSEKAFAAGADIKEMAPKEYLEAYKEDFFAGWNAVANCRKPLIAGVSGYALGGGCELAMMCDFIIAAENAKFGQPEITLGIIPGMGGTQRLARWVGKAKAMDLVLTGRMMDAEEAERCGLVSRIVSVEDLKEEVLQAAQKIAGFSHPATMMAKEAVNRAFETGMDEGVRFERRIFHSMFATADQKEGMQAFVEKRKPHFKHR